jgi:dTMP kinase
MRSLRVTTKRGGFFVLEGLDGSGTTTQGSRVVEHLRSRGVSCSLTREPTGHPIGRLIRDALSGTHATDEKLGQITLSEAALCLLFAADRIEHSVEIEALRAAGTHVISDRYVLSSIAYQSRDPGITPERVIEVNRGIALPDITFLLDVPVDECLRRLGRREDTPTIYERRDTLEDIAMRYEATLALYEQHYGQLVRIDGTRPIDAVTAEILDHLASYI